MVQTIRDYINTINNAPSFWGWCKSRSKWHFDYTKKDEESPIIRLGRFYGDWEEDIKKETAVHSPADQIDNEIIPSEKRDLQNWGYNGWGYDSMEPTEKLHKMAEMIGLENYNTRHNRQKPGNTRWYHLDACSCHYMEKLAKGEMKEDDVLFEEDTFLPKDTQLMRIFVMLTDWEPGHYFVVGNTPYTHWRKGDIWTFDWVNMPHGTANCGHTNRSMLKVVGYIGDKSRWIVDGEKREFRV